MHESTLIATDSDYAALSLRYDLLVAAYNRGSQPLARLRAAAGRLAHDCVDSAGYLCGSAESYRHYHALAVAAAQVGREITREARD